MKMKNKITINFGDNIKTFKKATIEFSLRNKELDHLIEISGSEAIIKNLNSIDLFNLGMYFERELNKLSDNKYVVVTWPGSQDFIGRPDCYLVNDDNGMIKFGSSAYIVPENIYNLVMTNKDKDDNNNLH